MKPLVMKKHVNTSKETIHERTNHEKSCGDSSYLFQSLYSLNSLSANSTNWSNTLKQFEETLTIETP